MNMSRSISADEDWSIISSSSDVDEETPSAHDKSDSENVPQTEASGDVTASSDAESQKRDFDSTVSDISAHAAPADSVNTLTGLEKAPFDAPAETDEKPGEISDSASSEPTPSEVASEDAYVAVSGVSTPSEHSESEEPEPQLENRSNPDGAKSTAESAVNNEIQRLEGLNSPSAPPALPPHNLCVISRTISHIDSRIRSASRSIFRALFADSYQIAEKRRKDSLSEVSLLQHAQYSFYSALHRNQDFLIYYAVALAVSICSVAAFRPAPKKEPTWTEKLNAVWVELAYEERKAGRTHSFLFARGEEPPRQLRITKAWNTAIERGPHVWADGSEAAKRFVERSSNWSKVTWAQLSNAPETQQLLANLADLRAKTALFASESAIPFMKDALSQGKLTADRLAEHSKVAASDLAKQAGLLSQKMQSQFESLQATAARELPHMKRVLDNTSRDLYKKYTEVLEELRSQCQ